MAALTLFALNQREWRPACLRRLSRRQWLVQTVLALTSGAVAPSMMFTAISRTSVTNIVLIETIEIPLVLLLAWLFYREKSSGTAVFSALCAVGGVATTLVLQMDASPESMAAARMRGGVGSGEVFAAAATVLLVCGAEIGRKQLQSIPLGIFSVYRNLLGALFFLGIGLYLFGIEHFADVFSPVLWGWMILYGGVVVACGQLSWFAGIKRAGPADIATASSFSPVAGVLFAGLILGEAPMPAQLIGGGIILTGIAIALWGELRGERPARPPRTEDKAKAFTGV